MGGLIQEAMDKVENEKKEQKPAKEIVASVFKEEVEKGKPEYHVNKEEYKQNMKEIGKQEKMESADEEFKRKIAEEFEKRDEELIEREMATEVMKDYFYQFTQGSRTVTGLSIVGIREIIRRMGHIHTQEPKIEDLGESWMCKTEIIDHERDIKAWGVSHQSKKMKLMGGTLIDDPLSLPKCASKSFRNAARQLIPEKIITKLYEKWQEDQKQMRKDSHAFM